MIATKPTIGYSDFEKVDIRIGRITAVEDFPKARKASFKLTIDFGLDVGVRRSSAQITARYTKEELVGKIVAAVVNFPAKRIADFESEVLVLGAADEEFEVILLSTDRRVPLGAKIF
ncbi:MAG TPA: tRNA-binding protein [Candidatus Eremiobacteraceae bacterium]|nr:tRNA-binding protein [Candidatus Eremiobacteraceae bacterium]